MASRTEQSEANRLEYPQRIQPHVPARALNTDYPLIDSDPYIGRVLRYARSSDYAHGLAFAAAGPLALYSMERISPSSAGKGGFTSAMRVMSCVGAFAGFFYFYSRSVNRFYGFSENRREVAMDMREMTDRVKRGEPIYGHSGLTEYMQGIAARQSRYSGLFLHVMPWFNFVNHKQHGVDTAKYYQQAERELEAERTASGS